MTADTSLPVLIVDDNPANLKLARVLLDAASFTVRTAGSAEEAFVELETFRPVIILMDLQLPGLDGLEATRQLKDSPELGHIPVVALTAFAMKGDAEKALVAGCDGYITKPLEPSTFAAEIRSYLETCDG